MITCEYCGKEIESGLLNVAEHVYNKCERTIKMTEEYKPETYLIMGEKLYELYKNVLAKEFKKYKNER